MADCLIPGVCAGLSVVLDFVLPLLLMPVLRLLFHFYTPSHSCSHLFPEMNKVSPAPVVCAGQKPQRANLLSFPLGAGAGALPGGHCQLRWGELEKG